MENVGCKTVIRLTERAVATSKRMSNGSTKTNQIAALEQIIDDLVIDSASIGALCDVMM